MYDALVIAEFERRQLFNQLTSVLHSPLRLTMWVASLGIGALYIVSRLVSMRRPESTAIEVTPAMAAILTAAVLVFLGIYLARNAKRDGARFATVIEATMVGASQLSGRSVFVWLQLRALWRTIVRMLFIFIVFSFTTRSIDAEFPRVALLGLALILIPPAYAFHIGLASDRVRRIVHYVGLACIALAVPVGFGKLPGASTMLLAAAHGAWWPLALLAVVVAIGVLLPTTDPIPELYAATRGGRVGARTVASRNPRATDGGRSSEWMFDLDGPWAILSARFAAFFHLRKPAQYAFGLAGWFGGGLLTGLAPRFIGTMAAHAIVSAGLVTGLIIVVVFATIGHELATEVRNPLWWTGDATVAARLAVDSLGSLWRIGTTVLAVLAGYGSAGHVHEALLSFVILIAGIWLARCSGYLLYAFFPAPIDQRGGLAGLRIFILVALALPILLVSGGAFALGISIEAQTVIIVAAAIVEALILLGVAARRIDGRVDAYV